MDDRLPEGRLGQVAGLVEVAEEAAGEAVTGAGGVLDFLLEACRAGEVAVAVHLDAAVLAALDDDQLRSQFQYPLGRRQDALGLDEGAGLGLVQRDDIHPAHRLDQ